MKPSALFLLLALAGVAPAYAGNTEAGLGGAVGGVLGTLVGQQVGGSTGAAIGAGVGGAAGGVLGADRRNRTEAAIGGGLGAAGGNVIGNRVGGSTGGLVGAALGGGAGGALGNNLGDSGRDDRGYRAIATTPARAGSTPSTDTSTGIGNEKRPAMPGVFLCARAY